MKDNGGPAFPESEYSGEDGTFIFSRSQGMSLRDYFAAKAMQGILSSGSGLSMIYEAKEEVDSFVAAARIAYGYADAMLEERDKE